MHDHAYNDKALFRLIAEGDETAFRQLFRTYAPQFHPMVLHLTKTPSVADDIIQETFLRVWLSRDKLPAIEQPRSWLLRILFYQSFTYLRRQAVHHKALDKLAPRQLENELRSTTEEALAYSSMLQHIGEAVEALPAQAKKIYLLSREQGMKIPEIAAALSLSPNTVKNSLVRSLQAIRKHLEAAGHFLPMLLLWLLSGK